MTMKAYIRTFLSGLIFFGSASSAIAGNWDTPKKDSCKDVHTRQYSAIIRKKADKKDWTEACKTLPITIDGTEYRARKCTQLITGMWGEFDVPDLSCLPPDSKSLGPLAPEAWVVERTRNWMGKLPDYMRLSDLSIPGTHDTASYNYGGPIVRTQAWDMTDQLKAGIRFLDIRIRNVNGKFRTVHGSVDLRMELDTVLDDIQAFLEEHPTETVLMRVLQQGDVVGGETTGQVWKRYLTKYPNLFLEGSNLNLSLGNARKKIVILCQSGCPYLTDFPHIKYDNHRNGYRKVANAAISGHNKKKLRNVTVEACQNACDMQEHNWVCESFDYAKSDQSCDLSDKLEYHVALKNDYPGNPYDFYEKKPGVKLWAKQQNEYKVGLTEASALREGMISMDSKLKAIRKALDEGNQPGWNLNWWSGAYGVVPGALSNQAIPDAGKMINELTDNGLKKRKLGINALDFPTEQIVYQIINSNFDGNLSANTPRADSGTSSIVEYITKNNYKIRFKNRWTSQYLNSSSVSDTVVDLNLKPVSDGYFQILNSAKDKRMRMSGQGSVNEAPLYSSQSDRGRWKIIEHGSGYFQIQNKRYPNSFLHNQNGALEAGAIQPGWWSAQWEIEVG